MDLFQFHQECNLYPAVEEATSQYGSASNSTKQMQLLGLMVQQQQEDVAALIVLLHQRRIRRQRHYWVRPWIGRRLKFGNYDNLMAELEREHHVHVTNYLRMDPAMFHELLQRMTPRLEKKDTKW